MAIPAWAARCAQQAFIGFRKRLDLFTFRADHANGALPHLHGYVQPGSNILEVADDKRESEVTSAERIGWPC